MKVDGLKLAMVRNRKYHSQSITDAVDADDIVLLANKPTQAETLLHSLGPAATSTRTPCQRSVDGIYMLKSNRWLPPTKWLSFETSGHVYILRINFHLLQTFCPRLGSFCVVSSFTKFRPNFTSGLLQVNLLRIEALSLYGSRWALSEDSGFKSYPSRPELYLVKNVVR